MLTGVFAALVSLQLSTPVVSQKIKTPANLTGVIFYGAGNGNRTHL